MALSVIWLSVILGAALGLWQRITTRATGPIRTFAVVAATLVVGLSLLPHALASEGLWGLLAALAGVALIPALDRLLRLWFREVSTGALRLEVGFVGLCVHRFGDGVVMAVDGHGNELIWAVGAHEVPIVALVTLAYARRGVAEALIRAVLLGGASSLGYWLVRVLPEMGHDLHGWADAVAAGILLHIVADTGLAEKLQNGRERALDVIAGLLGILMVLLPSSEHAPTPSLGARMLGHALESLPWLGLGLVLTATLSATGWMRKRGPWGVHASFIVLGSTLGFESVVLSARLLGVSFATAWVTSAVASSALAAIALGTSSANETRRRERTAPEAITPAPRFGKRWWGAFQERLLRVGGWVILGLLCASYIDAFVPQQALARAGMPAHTLIVAALALASFICTPAAIPIAAALLSKGLDPGIALAGLLLGPAATPLAVARARTRAGGARWLLALAATPLLAWGVAAFGDGLLDARALGRRSGSPGPLDWLAVGALVALLAQQIWQIGIRNWMGRSLTQPAGGEHRDRAPLELHAH